MTQMEKFALPPFVMRLKLIFHNEFFNKSEAQEANAPSFPHLPHPNITMYTFAKSKLTNPFSPWLTVQDLMSLATRFTAILGLLQSA
jgi:hypothetical protein